MGFCSWLLPVGGMVDGKLFGWSLLSLRMYLAELLFILYDFLLENEEDVKMMVVIEYKQ